ncbi:hypothetical protein AB9E28_00155 [Rhizobium leguminosarum]|uniref:hypothetical protein n=1 Tax=Rhizobium leguminosarum TaxID=384 RepID=UPI003F9CE212
MDFPKIAPYLQDPLVLMGFALFLFFGFVRLLIKSGTIPPLNQQGGFRVLTQILRYGFVLAIAIILLGFGLKYREMSRQEQAAAVRLISAELASNMEVAGELQKNTLTIMNAASTISTVLRMPGIKLLPAFFPQENLDPETDVPASLDYARQRIKLATDQGVLLDKLEMQKFGLAGQAIAGTISRTQSTIRSLADEDRTRYVISDSAWQAQLPILRRINIIDAARMEGIYADLRLLRTNYGVVVHHCMDYTGAVHTFFVTSPVTEQSLSEVLAGERIFMLTATAYSKSVADKLQRVEEARTYLSDAVRSL